MMTRDEAADLYGGEVERGRRYRIRYTQIANTVIDHAIQAGQVKAAERISAVDYACYDLSAAVVSMEDAAKGPTTPAERSALEATAHAMSIRLDKLVETLQGGR